MLAIETTRLLDPHPERSSLSSERSDLPLLWGGKFWATIEA